MDACTGYVAYRALDEQALAPEIAEMGHLIEQTWRTLEIDKDFGAGIMLWLAHFSPDEPWRLHSISSVVQVRSGTPRCIPRIGLLANTAGEE